MLTYLSVISSVISVLALLSLFRARPKLLKKGNLQKISILKPIRGLEPHLQENLESFFLLNKTIPFTLYFSVKNPRDPAISVIESLIEKYPHVEAFLFIDTPDLGRNPKVSNIHYSWNRASSDLILISDSNVRVPPNYLERLYAERKRGAGLVTQAVFAADAKGLGGHLDAVSLNTNYLKGTFFLSLIGHQNVLGKCMLQSKSQFNSLGGLDSVKNYLAEDLMMGEIMKQSGYTVGLAPELLRQTSIMTEFSDFWNRHVRWARLRKCHVPHFYILEPLFFETIWPLALIAFSPTPSNLAVGLSCLAVQWGASLLVHKLKIKDPSSFKSLKYFLVKDLIMPFVWGAGLISNKVVWRGQNLYLRFGGTLRAPKGQSVEARA